MAITEGRVLTVRVDQEKEATVLRLVIESGTDRIPVEMRGIALSGVVEVGDQVVIPGAARRGRDGVLRPKAITNETTNSIVRARKRRLFKRFFGFVFSLAISVGTGVLTSIIVGHLVPKSLKPPIQGLPRGGHPSSGMPSQLDPLTMLIGLVVGLFVFYLLFLRKRRG